MYHRQSYQNCLPFDSEDDQHSFDVVEQTRRYPLSESMQEMQYEYCVDCEEHSQVREQMDQMPAVLVGVYFHFFVAVLLREGHQ